MKMIKYSLVILLIGTLISCTKNEQIDDSNAEVVTKASGEIVKYTIKVYYVFTNMTNLSSETVAAVFNSNAENFKRSIPRCQKFTLTFSYSHYVSIVFGASLDNAFTIRTALEDYLSSCSMGLKGVEFSTDISFSEWNEGLDEEDGGGKNDDWEDLKIPTPYFDKLCLNDLSVPVKQRLEIGIETLIGNYRPAERLFKMLIDNRVKLNFQFAWEGNEQHYYRGNHTYLFSRYSSLDSFEALEQWVYIIQDLFFYTSNRPPERNNAFEAKMFCDICMSLKVTPDPCQLFLAKGLGNKMTDELTFLDKYRERGSLDAELMVHYYFELGKVWNDPSCQSDQFLVQAPMVMGHLIGIK